MTADQILTALAAAGLSIVSVHIGDPANPETWTFFAPGTREVVPVDDATRQRAVTVVRQVFAPVSSTPVVSKLAFLRLITPAEYNAVVLLARQGDATLTYALALLDSSFQLTPTEPTFVQMLAYCVAVGVFSQARADAIVAAMSRA